MAVDGRVRSRSLFFGAMLTLASLACREPDPEQLTFSPAPTAPPQATVALVGAQPVAPAPPAPATRGVHAAAAAPVYAAPAPARQQDTASASHGTGGPVHVREYTRRDGTVVHEHTRSAPHRRH